jgi:hypothetical protein
MSKIGNYVVELQELTDSVMELGPFKSYFAIDDVCGCNHCVSKVILNGEDYITTHNDNCPVVKLREVLTKQGSK